MNRLFASEKIILPACLCLLFYFVPAQDKIYTVGKKVLTVKVVEINPPYISYLDTDSTINRIHELRVDYIEYASGRRVELKGGMRKKLSRQIIPQLNTLSFDFLGLAFQSLSFSYEHRLKNGRMGFRVPLYVGVNGGRIAGVGTFTRLTNLNSEQLSYNDNYYGTYYYGEKGICIATGINPKFYFIKRRIVRLFLGPEVAVGYSVNHTSFYYADANYNEVEFPMQTYRYGTFAGLGKFGVSLNPLDMLNISFDFGVGAGSLFGPGSAARWVGLGHIGLAAGINF